MESIMLYKRALRYFFFTVISVICLFLILTPILDPYMLFHPKWFKKDLIYENLRVQDYGLITFWDMDSIILGTSMMQNTSAKEASAKLNGNFMNLSFPGASYFEKSTVLNYAIKTKNIKHIIMSLDFQFDKIKEIGDSFFPDLYTQTNILGKYKFYMHSQPLKCLLLNKCNSKFIKYNDDTPVAWHKGHTTVFGGFENWLKNAEIRFLTECIKCII